VLLLDVVQKLGQKKSAAATKYSNANQNLVAAAADVTKLATE